MAKDLQRYKLILAYDGTQYKGFQRQSNGEDAEEDGINPNNISAAPPQAKRRRLTGRVPPTVQESVENAIVHYTGLKRSALVPRFAGRTDGGVHARGQVFVSWMPKEEDHGCLWNIRKSINSRLPADISVEDVSPCAADFDPRSAVKWKRYSYTLKYRRKVFSNNHGELLPICKSGPNTFRSGLDAKTFWLCPWALDDKDLKEVCEKLTGNHDYSVFVHKKARGDKDNNITVDKIEPKMLQETDEDAPVVTVKLDFEAKGFRRSMVRNLVGFIVDVCRGQLESSIFDELWSATDEIARKIHSAPACGLCLEYVQY